ncbi:Metallo-dependent phosphatase [Macrolepiota fuliginosa MF-IS2]|uniref:Metallo-dependent phosphatase n=1 Tax=Macrolepiota fuliginosa MF-IS2 TaxID=1400762 RepID=A0A9P5XL32_9AGAR|nr:Metallo-dependent phosphatase [Macrolepiota fuliginosa MF-IS2]
MTGIPILHFNDVYRVSPQKIRGSDKTIDVTQFSALVNELRGKWKEREDGQRDGLVLFSGDLFSPSVESSVTRGSHMVPVMNEIGVDVALTGNHDFDFGYLHLTKLIQDSTYPWIVSNILDSTTGTAPEHIHPFEVIERCGIRIGIIGLVEEDWIATVASWPSEFKYRDMVEAGLELSKLLRDPEGEHRCDIILALTHCRLPNDIALAKRLLALSPSGRDTQPIINEHGVDALLGGHDHLYYVSKGAGDWEGYDKKPDILGAEEDKGDILVFKSGYDFKELSELVLELEDTPEGSVRRKLIKNVTGKHHAITPEMQSSAKLSEILKNVLSSVNSAMKAPVCRSTITLDLRSRYIRVDESAAGNWFADVLRHAYDDALCMKGSGGSDGVFICAGTLRGDSMYGPGIITVGDILEILPFDDPVVVLELDGETIWEVLEVALEPYPAQEGRFPVISGFKVTWDSRRPPGQRVISVALLKNSERRGKDGLPERTVEEEPIPKQKDGRKYSIVTRDYIAEGHDGFVVLKGKPYLVDHESGGLMSGIVRKYLLGSQFVNKMMRLAENERPQNLSKGTSIVIDEALKEREREGKHRDEKAANKWKMAIDLVIHRARTQKHYQNNLYVSTTEHMSSIDPFDGSTVRKGQECALLDHAEVDQDLLVISPEVDGRLKDIGRDSVNGS